MDRQPPHTVAPGAPDHTDPLHGIGRRIAISAPGAVAIALLVGALMFGIGIRAIDTLGGHGANRNEITQVSTTRHGEAQGEPGAKPGGSGKGDATKGSSNGAGAKADEPTATRKPGDDGAATSAVKALSIHLARDGRKVVIEWSACRVDGFALYRVVRSTDAVATWPLGKGDHLIAALGAVGSTRVVDTHAAAGHRYHYRVLGIAKRDGHPRVACRSAVRSIVTPKPEPAPDPTPAVGFGLVLSIADHHPYVDWTVCHRSGADYYKIVRSPDSTVRWPVGGNDSLAGYVAIGGKTALWDGDAPHGKRVWYRVFCVDATESGYRVLAASAAKSIVTPADEEPPAPSEMDLEVDATDGEVVLGWDECGSDGFSYYKVVRSQNSNPSYLPWTEGSQVIAVIENPGTTSFTDSDVESGQTWYYRVQSIGYWHGQKVVLGQTPVRSVTIP